MCGGELAGKEEFQILFPPTRHLEGKQSKRLRVEIRFGGNKKGPLFAQNQFHFGRGKNGRMEGKRSERERGRAKLAGRFGSLDDQ